MAVAYKDKRTNKNKIIIDVINIYIVSLRKFLIDRHRGKPIKEWRQILIKMKESGLITDQIYTSMWNKNHLSSLFERANIRSNLSSLWNRSSSTEQVEWIEIKENS